MSIGQILNKAERPVSSKMTRYKINKVKQYLKWSCSIWFFEAMCCFSLEASCCCQIRQNGGQCMNSIQQFDHILLRVNSLIFLVICMTIIKQLTHRSFDSVAASSLRLSFFQDSNIRITGSREHPTVMHYGIYFENWQHHYSPKNKYKQVTIQTFRNTRATLQYIYFTYMKSNLTGSRDFMMSLPSWLHS